MNFIIMQEKGIVQDEHSILSIYTSNFSKKEKYIPMISRSLFERPSEQIVDVERLWEIGDIN